MIRNYFLKCYNLVINKKFAYNRIVKTLVSVRLEINDCKSILSRMVKNFADHCSRWCNIDVAPSNELPMMTLDDVINLEQKLALIKEYLIAINETEKTTKIR